MKKRLQITLFFYTYTLVFFCITLYAPPPTLQQLAAKLLCCCQDYSTPPTTPRNGLPNQQILLNATSTEMQEPKTFDKQDTAPYKNPTAQPSLLRLRKTSPPPSLYEEKQPPIIPALKSSSSDEGDFVMVNPPQHRV